MIPVEDMPGYYRDSETGAIINKNKTEYLTYVSKRTKLTADQKRLQSVEGEVSALKDDVGEIKSMLEGITDLLRGNK